MEDVTAMYYLPTMRKTDPNFDIQTRTVISGSTLGFTTQNEDLYNTITSFLENNEEHKEVIRTNAIRAQVKTNINFYSHVFYSNRQN